MEGINMSVGYGVTTVLSLLLAVGYCALMKKKDTWLMLLFGCVVIVNMGYFSLSISKTLSEALLANRISYFGSVFLPLCMLMSIMTVCRLRCSKYLMGMLLCASIAVFILAASPGYLDLYYREVSLIFINGMAKLKKEYGSLHFVYLVYLMSYFGMMIGVILHSFRKKKLVSYKHAVLLLIIVLLNIAIWYVEQLVYSDFEFLSVSYIISELLLMMLYGMLQDYGIVFSSGDNTMEDSVKPARPVHIQSQDPILEEEPSEVAETAEFSDERIAGIVESWAVDYVLTGRECDVLRAILKNKKRKEIAEEMSVTEHTVKKHTGNIFSKLEVTSRAELFALADRE